MSKMATQRYQEQQLPPSQLRALRIERQQIQPESPTPTFDTSTPEGQIAQQRYELEKAQRQLAQQKKILYPQKRQAFTPRRYRQQVEQAKGEISAAEAEIQKASQEFESQVQEYQTAKSASEQYRGGYEQAVREAQENRMFRGLVGEGYTPEYRKGYEQAMKDIEKGSYTYIQPLGSTIESPGVSPTQIIFQPGTPGAPPQLGKLQLQGEVWKPQYDNKGNIVGYSVPSDTGYKSYSLETLQKIEELSKIAPKEVYTNIGTGQVSLDKPLVGFGWYKALSNPKTGKIFEKPEDVTNYIKENKLETLYNFPKQKMNFDQFKKALEPTYFGYKQWRSINDLKYQAIEVIKRDFGVDEKKANEIYNAKVKDYTKLKGKEGITWINIMRNAPGMGGRGSRTMRTFGLQTYQTLAEDLSVAERKASNYFIKGEHTGKVSSLAPTSTIVERTIGLNWFKIGKGKGEEWEQLYDLYGLKGEDRNPYKYLEISRKVSPIYPNKQYDLSMKLVNKFWKEGGTKERGLILAALLFPPSLIFKYGYPAYEATSKSISGYLDYIISQEPSQNVGYLKNLKNTLKENSKYILGMIITETGKKIPYVGKPFELANIYLRGKMAGAVGEMGGVTIAQIQKGEYKPALETAEVAATLYGVGRVFGPKRQSGQSQFLRDINPKTRELRQYMPWKYLLRKEWSELIPNLSQYQYDKLTNMLKEQYNIRIAKSLTPEQYIKGILLRANKIGIPKEITSILLKETARDLSYEITGSSITKNVYMRKVAKTLLEKKIIDDITYKALTQVGDWDILKKPSLMKDYVRIPKKYYSLDADIRSAIRGLIPKKEQIKYINKKGIKEFVTQEIPEILIKLNKNYEQVFKNLDFKMKLKLKGSIIRAIEIYNQYKRGQLTKEDWEKYFESIKPKEKTLPNGKKIIVFKDIDMEYTKLNRKFAQDYISLLNKVIKNHELIIEKISVGSPIGRLLDATKTLQVQVIKEKPTIGSKIVDNLKRMFGRSAVAYLSEGSTKKFDLYRLRDKIIEKLNEQFGYKGNDPNKLNSYTVDLGVGTFIERLLQLVEKKTILEMKGKKVGYAQTILKNLNDALDVTSTGKLEKQDLYLRMKVKTGELKPFEANTLFSYERSIRNTSLELFRKIRELQIKRKVEPIEGLFPAELMEGAYSFGDKIQLLTKSIYNLYPEFKSIKYRSRMFASPIGQVLQQFQAAVMSGDKNKILRNAIVLQQQLNSAYWKNRKLKITNVYSRNALSRAIDLIKNEPMPESKLKGWVKYFTTEKFNIERFKIGKSKIEQLNLIKNAFKKGREIKSYLFETIDELAKKIEQNRRYDKIEYYLDRSRYNSQKIRQIKDYLLKEKNSSKRINYVKNILKEQLSSSETNYDFQRIANNYQKSLKTQNYLNNLVPKKYSSYNKYSKKDYNKYQRYSNINNYLVYPKYPTKPTYPKYPKTSKYPTYPKYPKYPKFNNYLIYPKYPTYPKYPKYPKVPSTTYPKYKINILKEKEKERRKKKKVILSRRTKYMTLPTAFEQLTFRGPKSKRPKVKIRGFEVFRFR